MTHLFKEISILKYAKFRPIKYSFIITFPITSPFQIRANKISIAFNEWKQLQFSWNSKSNFQAFEILERKPGRFAFERGKLYRNPGLLLKIQSYKVYAMTLIRNLSRNRIFTTTQMYSVLLPACRYFSNLLAKVPK